MVKRPSEDTEVTAARKQWLTLSMDPRIAEQMGHFRLTAAKPGTYSGSCIMALRAYVLISLLGTQCIQYISMIVQLRLSLARSSMLPQANYHH